MKTHFYVNDEYAETKDVDPVIPMSLSIGREISVKVKDSDYTTTMSSHYVEDVIPHFDFDGSNDYISVYLMKGD